VSLQVGDDHLVALRQEREDRPERLTRHEPTMQEDERPAAPVDLVIEIDAVDLGILAGALRLGGPFAAHGHTPWVNETARAGKSVFEPDLPIIAIALLAALPLPRVIAHDLRLIEIDGPVYTALAIAPLLIWLLVALFRRTERPFFDFLVLGLVYGLFLGLTHQILWDASWAGNPPHMGGNLAGKLDPYVESVILRAFALGSSIVTGLVFGAAFGIVAFVAMKFRNRRPSRMTR